jgi:hypothetical protein
MFLGDFSVCLQVHKALQPGKPTSPFNRRETFKIRDFIYEIIQL